MHIDGFSPQYQLALICLLNTRKVESVHDWLNSVRRRYFTLAKDMFVDARRLADTRKIASFFRGGSTWQGRTGPVLPDGSAYWRHFENG